MDRPDYSQSSDANMNLSKKQCFLVLKHLEDFWCNFGFSIRGLQVFTRTASVLVFLHTLPPVLFSSLLRILLPWVHYTFMI